MSLRVAGLTKRHGRGSRSVLALDAVDLEAGPGELLVLVGPSGSGKSSLLRAVAGLDLPDAGRVEVAGQDVTDRPAGQRDVAMVFQALALYPHLTVEGNLDFDLAAGRVPAGERAQRTDTVLARLDLAALRDRRPRELSGGEQQRVALARALVRRPALLLLDEPFSTIDAEHRHAFAAELRRHQRDLALTTVLVTHDSTEAMSLGDRIAVLDAGRVVQVGPPQEVWERPASTTVARRFGEDPMNLLPAADGDGTLGVRPGDLRLAPDGEPAPPAHLAVGHGVVTDRSDLGDRQRTTVSVGGQTVLAVDRARAELTVGDAVQVWADETRVHRFDADGRRRGP